MTLVTVIKRNPEGKETWRYSGRVLSRSKNTLTIEAAFNRPDVYFHDIFLKQGDNFVENYYTDRWYNIFEIHDRDDGNVKGWYCNVTCPMVIEEEKPGQIVISYIDLALDLLVYPDGQQLILDEDEYAALTLDSELDSKVRQALVELQGSFAKKLGTG